ncbi:hypothetical protein [Acetobacterium carbinolicum]
MSNANGNKTIYANSGTWIDSNPGNLYQYTPDQTITQWVAGQAITSN